MIVAPAKGSFELLYLRLGGLAVVGAATAAGIEPLAAVVSASGSFTAV